MLGHFPVADPHLWIGQSELDFQSFSIVDHLVALDDMERVTGGNPETVVNPMMVRNKIYRIHNKCVAFPVTDGFAVETANRNVRIRMGASIEINDAHAVHQLADHVNRPPPLNHSDR